MRGLQEREEWMPLPVVFRPIGSVDGSGWECTENKSRHLFRHIAMRAKESSFPVVRNSGNDAMRVKTLSALLSCECGFLQINAL